MVDDFLRFFPSWRDVVAVAQAAIVRKDEAEARGRQADPLTSFLARLPRRMGYEIGP